MDRSEILGLLCVVLIPALWLAYRNRLPGSARRLLAPVWVPIALLIGWGPLALTDLICSLESRPGTTCGMGFGMAWGMTVSLLSLVVAAGFIV